MAKTLAGAVFGMLAADATLAALVPSGAWLDEVPAELALPWLVVRHQGETPAWASESDYTEDTRLLVECYASRDLTQPAGTQAHPAEAAEKIARQVMGILDRKTPVLTGAQGVMLLRRRYTLALDANRAPDDERVYRATLEYLGRVQRTLTS